MRSISIDSDNGLFEGYINLYVASTKNLDALISKLKKEKGILKVVRTDMKD
jgi:GTP pyrophosphokinase